MDATDSTWHAEDLLEDGAWHLVVETIEVHIVGINSKIGEARDLAICEIEDGRQWIHAQDITQDEKLPPPPKLTDQKCSELQSN
jgi:hypothetical protein